MVRQCAGIDACTIFHATGGPATAAAAAINIAVCGRLTVNLGGEVTRQPRGFHCGAIAVKSGIISAFGINVIADVAAIRFHHIAAQTDGHGKRSEDHTSELQSLMRSSDAVFSLKIKTKDNTTAIPSIIRTPYAMY